MRVADGARAARVHAFCADEISPVLRIPGEQIGGTGANFITRAAAVFKTEHNLFILKQFRDQFLLPNDRKR